MPLPKKNSSIVWKHFRKNENHPDMAICTLCKNSYKRCNGTTNLLDHLKRKHLTVLNRDKIIQNEESDDDFNTPGKYYVYTKFKGLKRIDYLLFRENVIILPFYIFE
jgi:hypothetical protein